jgi:hypothetical protein
MPSPVARGAGRWEDGVFESETVKQMMCANAVSTGESQAGRPWQKSENQAYY